MRNHHTPPLLSVRGLQLAYGGIRAVKGIDFDIYAGELLCIIGANGAGKSSTMKAISGLLPPSAGEIHYQGCNTRELGAWDLAAQGLVMVPEGRGIFTRMSIEENLRIGAYTQNNRTQIAADIARSYELFPRLAQRRGQLAGTLSGGEQQMLAMARALMAHPKLLLLDEPSMGLAPMMVDKIFEIIQMVAAQGVTILLVEQNAQRALNIAARAVVMDSGSITLAGDARILLFNPQVQQAYLGG